MDSSSRKIVTFIAVIAIIVVVAMAARSYLDAEQNKSAPTVEAQEAIAPEAPKPDPAENAPKASEDMPVATPEIEDIPAITGEPSMTFENEKSETTEPAAPETAD
eukprot:gene14043-18951_t